MSTPSGSTVIGLSANCVTVGGKRVEGDDGQALIWLNITSNVHGADGGIHAVRISFDATEVTDLVRLARSIDEAVAGLVLDEYPEPEPGLHVDAEPVEVPDVLTAACPDVAFVPIETEALAVGDWLIDHGGDPCKVLAAYESPWRMVVACHDGPATAFNYDLFTFEYVRSAWRQVPASPEDVS